MTPSGSIAAPTLVLEGGGVLQLVETQEPLAMYTGVGQATRSDWLTCHHDSCSQQSLHSG
jgi:hypothetical protein